MMKETKNKLLADIAISISLFTALFFFPSMEIYLGNMTEFVVIFRDIFVPMFGLSVIAALINFALLRLAGKIKTKLYNALFCIEMGLLLAFYAQELFMNGRMLDLGSDQSVYLDDTKLIAANTAIYFVILILPSVLHIAAGMYKDKTAFVHAVKGMRIFVPAVVFVMQLVGFVSLMAANVKNFGLIDYRKYLSYEPLMSYSKDENTIVLLVDRLDGEWFDEYLETMPELKEGLDGFTYYRNNLSRYSFTFPSIVEMLSQKPYEGGNTGDYLHEAWSGRDMMDELKDAGWEVDLLVDKSTTYYSINDIKDKCDNIKSSDDIIHVNYNIIMRTMTDISFGKVMPYLLKPLFIYKYNSTFSMSFIKYNYLPEDYMFKLVNSTSDIMFYNYISTHDVTADSQKNKFVFAHLNGIHDVSADVSAIYPGYQPGTPPDYDTTARGTFKIVFDFFDKLKQAGVYDNTNIIVLGDHGRQPYEYILETSDDIVSPIVTGLLIKPAGSGGALKINNTAEMSNCDLAASVIEMAGIDTDKYGDSYSDIEKNDIHRERYFGIYKYVGNDLSDFLTYAVNGDARDINNWSRTDGKPMQKPVPGVDYFHFNRTYQK